MLTYPVRRAASAISVGADWDSPFWAPAETAELVHFRPESSDHRPRTEVRLLYDHRGLHGIFRVEDRFVVCRKTQYQARVCEDSCVEFFVRPKPGLGYFNFEFNCSGTLLCWYITDWRRSGDRFAAFSPLPEVEGQQVRVAHSLSGVIDPELAVPTTWTLSFCIPFAVLERYVGALGKLPGQVWTGNFYKCADACTYPHWAAWSPVDELNFHLPRCFGALAFGE